ncbi:MAG: hypothetical protein R2824_02325 [Saprospiraceae bacterium]|nr:hypothetical protein [Lewinella sp.]
MENTYQYPHTNTADTLRSKLNRSSFMQYAIVLLAFSTGVCLCWSCQSGFADARSSFVKSDQLIEAIHTFETKRTESQDGLKFAYDKIDSILQHYDVESARPLTIEFEEVWSEVLQRIDNLRQQFNTVCRRSATYFSILERETALLNDMEKKEEQEQRNAILRQHWDHELGKAEATFAQIKLLLDNGNDLYRLMLISTLRATLSEEIGEIQQITARADKLLLDLRQLAEEGLEMLPQA